MYSAEDIYDHLWRKYGVSDSTQRHQLSFYCHAWCLVTQSRPLTEPYRPIVRAWASGPVVGGYYFDQPGWCKAGTGGTYTCLDSATSKDDAVIERVMESYGKLDPEELGKLVRSEDPWRQAFDGTSDEYSPVISDAAILRYYSGLMASDAETQMRHHVPYFGHVPHITASAEEFDLPEDLKGE